ncbi:MULTISPECIES: UDP-N-acetylmuramate--L-alanine ligase [Sphingomonas]|jgi:UDP-N-acetylmuramate--alanine ligase|uniref:UDP-N-acetylmuramate--L-alanine ligase n=1 Tax=Sphingomonas ginsenosidimutans TaxID=862134 RepID=A0A2A4I2V2_9SPHN|nr:MULTISPECIES: UDP-N-acetylmuramate--L-alanine ligase [Sphingomonas]MBY0302919.1 UDP-N-acetylmuramate--L-alanine ligase [Sphingomonas ginsenosidimutans]PCG10509.1 UDP-N-acetylmuramate--L-alanine ligase [Sphingomonas ginsenosidimutans]
MKGVGTDIGTIHFVGIGGIGMSGIAEVMHNLGYKVQGSDVAEGYVVEGLRSRGIPVTIGHDAANVDGVAVVVTSTAVKRGNPEVEAALKNRIPVVRRAEMLAELMRLKSTVAVAGTHGKTTTTSMVAALLDAGGVDPTVINGGIINSYGSNARLGASDWMVVEADESDGSFLRLDGTIAVVTNIDPEHLDHYGDFDAAKRAYVEFVENVPFYGAALLCLDHPEVQALIPRVRDRRIVTYGFAASADVRGVNVTPYPGGNRFEALIRHRDGSVRSIEGIDLPMPGRHNVQNALAAIGVALELGISDATIQKGFERFSGVKRRFTKVGEVPFADGGVATVIDDYGHHPVEIRAVLAAARESAQAVKEGGRVIAVVQPHRYSRLGNLMEDFRGAFNDADLVYVAPVYAAGEAPVAGVDAEALVAGLRDRGHRHAEAIADAEALADALAGEVRSGDQVICLGAGDITKWAAGLAAAIEARR